MKKGSYLKYLLVIGVVLILFGANGNITTSTPDNDELLSYADVELDMTNKDSDSELITYKNTYPYSVELSSDNITIYCTGSGSTKEADEALAEKNFKVTAKFKKKGENKAKNSIILDKNEEVFIEISSNYEGEKPNNEVSCQFGINIGVS